MEERKINFVRNEDPTIVLDQDGSLYKELQKVYQSATLNLGFCCEQLQDGKLTEGMKQNHMSLAETYMVDFLKAIGYDGILERDKKKRFAEIRGLNDENRELRSQLGEKISNEDVREKIKNLSKKFKSWWNINGFGHSQDVKFSENGFLECKLSGLVSGAYYSDENTSKNYKKEKLKEYGFELATDSEVLSNDNNTSLLSKLLTSKFPSSEILEIKTSFYGGEQTYREIKVLIRNLEDII